MVERISLVSLLRIWGCLLIVSVQTLLLVVLPATSHELRILRPQGGIEPIVFFEEHNALEDFNRWCQVYASPTMCPMVLCHGRCALRSDRCMITQEGSIRSCLDGECVEDMFLRPDTTATGTDLLK